MRSLPLFLFAICFVLGCSKTAPTPSAKTSTNENAKSPSTASDTEGSRLATTVAEASPGSHGSQVEDAPRAKRDVLPNPFATLTATGQPFVRAKKLPKREPVTGPRFTELAVQKTGLDFGHAWSPPAGYRLEVYNSLPGGSVCVGDYDQDGWPDVFLTQPNIGTKLYRNLGGMRFEDVTAKTVGNSPKALGASFVDIDSDADLDLYICNNGLPNQLYINDGAGKFQEAAKQFGIDYSGASVMAAFSDYDRDGDMDMYLVTNRAKPTSEPKPVVDASGNMSIRKEDLEYIDMIETAERPRVISAGQFDHLYRNNGNGQLEDVSEQANIAGNHWGLSATWWDYDRDGWMDLYVANDYYGPDHLYRNQRDGTFEDVAKQSFPHTPWYSMGSDAADINNDGWLDFMGADMSGTSHYKQKSSMGDMSTTGWFLVHPTPRQYMRNALYLNTGTDRFMEIAQMAGVSNTDWTWSLKFGDLDEDGWLDLFVTNGMNRDWTNSDLRNKSNRASSEQEKIQIWLDSSQRRDANLAFRNGQDLQFSDQGKAWGLGSERVSYGAAFADFDRDGDLDVVANNAESAVSLFRNETSDSHRVLIRLVGKESNPWSLGATLRATTPHGTLTRVLNSCQGYMSANEPLVHFGLGDCESIEKLEITWPSGKSQVLKELAADTYYEVSEPTTAVAASTENTAAEISSATTGQTTKPMFAKHPLFSGYRHQETPFNDFARQPLLPNQHSQLGPRIAQGDVNGDGKVDFVVAGASGQPTTIFFNNNGQLEQQVSDVFQAAADYEDLGCLLFDADNDDDLDLYVVSGGVECEPDDELLQDRLYLNDGTGKFVGANDRLPTMTSSGFSVSGSDFDKDGDIDLFVGGRVVPGQYPIAPKSYLLRNDDGKFVDVGNGQVGKLSEVGLVTDSAWADINGDGTPDLVLATEWGAIRVFSNQDGQLVETTKQTGLSTHLGWWNALSLCDVDADGDTDIVAGNFGWNTKYHASEDQPALLYYGDFEKTGRMRLVEAEYEDKNLFPVRGKSCSTNAMPFLGNKFGTFHDFAAASLTDIYSSSSLDKAYRFAATTLTSGVFVNDGDGQFAFKAFPTLAQAAPICQIVSTHVDDDAHLDLILAQNFFGPQPETGHFDGGVGLVLQGKGDGTFAAIMPNRSGIVVPGDATDVILTDTDQDGVKEIIFTTNDGPIFSFKRIGE